MKKLRALLAALPLLAMVPSAGHAAAPFYDGKTVTIIVGQEAGSGADLSCRLIAEFLAKHVAGEPTIIVKNMPGSASMIATNFVGREAKKDGLTMDCGPYAPSFQLFHNPALQVDMTKFDIIAGDGETPLIYMRTDVPPGIKTSQDLFKVKPADLVLGGFAVDSQKDVGARAFLSMVGMDGYKYVTGFPGDPAGRAATQQKFINIYSESMTSFDQVTRNTLAKTGEVLPIAQGGTLDANGKRIRDPRAPDVPTFGEVYSTHFGKPPSGPAWQVLDLIMTNANLALDWLTLPPGSPPDALAAMRAAIAPLNADPDFVGASDRIRGKGKTERPGAQVQAALNKYLNPPPEVFQFFSDLVKSGFTLVQKKG